MQKLIASVAIAAALATACAPEPGPESAARAEILVREAVVESVDQKVRKIVIRGDDNQIGEIVAGPEVRNLDQIEAGDTIRLEYYQAVAARVAEPDDPGGAIVLADAERAELGAKPGASATKIVNMVVEFISYDPDTAVATFIGPDDIVHTTRVHPKMQAFAAARKSGDRIELLIEQAVAVSVQEIAG